MLQPKNYQLTALDELKKYFQTCLRLGNADTAFYETTLNLWGRGISYNPVKELPGLPYVCLRIPTGGGKTLMACFAAGIAQRDLLNLDRSLIVWLVPSKPILDQTLKALKKREHPYRNALESAVGSIEVFAIGEALSLNRSLFESHTVIIVSTIQAFRVEETEGRKVYEQSGHLLDHFSDIPSEIAAKLECYSGSNTPIPSLANVLRTRRPIVIVDEAHNARTPLSFDTLARLGPSCIIEFTATPDLGKLSRDEAKISPDMENRASNVLYSVSAAELKAEQMIKLPIKLEIQSDWKVLLTDAINQRNNLEELAKREEAICGDYLRPIMLLQAQSQLKEHDRLTVDVIEKCLIDEFQIPKEQIVKATSTDHELPDNILSSECPVRFVITVQALREGWDCPFAYILCSVAEMKGSRGVEQILGRILRMPKAKLKTNKDLNYAYAFVSSSSFAQAAETLTDALIENGFKRQEAKDLIAPLKDNQSEIEWDSDSLFSAGREPQVFIPRVKGEFSVPVLAVKVGDLFEQLEEIHLLENDWSLALCEADLLESEYSPDKPAGDFGEIDISKGGQLVASSFIPELQKQIGMLELKLDISEVDLIRWLDQTIYHPDIPMSDMELFLIKAMKYLLGNRSVHLKKLVKDRYRLRNAIDDKVKYHRQQSMKAAFQELLDPETALHISVTPKKCFTYDPEVYPYNEIDTKHYKWKKHYYPKVGKMNGEEFDCAAFLDGLDEVKWWVRNISQKAQHSFWLQTTSDRHFPDFVCLLNDGRYLVVEYKSERDWSNDDSVEKRWIGELWEKRSGGNCFYVMPKGKDLEAIRAKVKL